MSEPFSVGQQPRLNLSHDHPEHHSGTWCGEPVRGQPACARLLIEIDKNEPRRSPSRRVVPRKGPSEIRLAVLHLHAMHSRTALLNDPAQDRLHNDN